MAILPASRVTPWLSRRPSTEEGRPLWRHPEKASPRLWQLSERRIRTTSARAGSKRHAGTSLSSSIPSVPASRWKALSKGEDGEAPRRLFYVAMTRARRSLSVVTSGAHAFVRADSESEVLRHVETPRRQDLPDPDQYQVPDLTSVDLPYAGRLAATSPTHDAISATNVDDPVTLDRRDGKWMILDAKRRVLGRMSGNWAPPEGTDLVNGKIGAIVRWRRSDNEESYLKREEWETVLVELVFRRSGAR